MKRSLKLPAVLLLSIVVFGAADMRCNGGERPGEKEQTEVDDGNSELDRVYRDLISKGESEEQAALREAQRAWIKWRDAEAMYIARHGGAIGGSAMRVAYAEAQSKLINERIETLKEYASQAPEN
jgi:uncharacterized protein YecT (DUF1311 family)